MKRRILVRVGSRNAAKLRAVEHGLSPFYEAVAIEPADVESGVDAQPIGIAEIVAGARNRAHAAWGSGNCDLAAGIEDGLMPVPQVRTGFINVGCCMIFDGTREGIGFTAGFEYPPDCVAAATSSGRTPIGDAFDARFVAPAGFPDPGSGAGNIGRLTGGRLDRAAYGAQAVTCALLRFLHPSLYPEDRP